MAITMKALSEARHFIDDGQTVNDISVCVASWLLWKQPREEKNTAAASSSVSDIYCIVLRILLASLHPIQHCIGRT